MSIKTTKSPIISTINKYNLQDYKTILIPCNDSLARKIPEDFKIESIESLGLGDQIIKMMKDAEFVGKIGQVVTSKTLNKKGEFVSVVLFGTESEEVKKIDLSHASACFRAGGLAASYILPKAESILLESVKDGDRNIFTDEEMIAFAGGLADAVYSFTNYMTDDSKTKTMNTIRNIHVYDGISDELVKEINNVTESTYITRDLVNYPPNDLYPISYANFIMEEFKKHNNVEVKIYDENELEKLGMRMLLGVAKASEHPPRVVTLKYTGDSKKKEYPIALVGKGVTFDSGGLSLKPSNYMMDMKTDMGGSAAVVGAIKVLAMNETKENVVGIIGLVENAVGSKAQRPGDVVKSFSGKTVEVLNTDAEGRLVLGDIMSLVQKEYKPKYMIDLATLTGAICVALGDFYAGLFSNSIDLSHLIIDAGNRTGEKVHNMPMGDEYAEMIKSQIADIKNISNTGLAGSTTAAEFLKHFVEKGVSWAHIDIAGTAYFSKKYPSSHKNGATGFGVRLIYSLIKSIIKNGLH